MVSFREKHLWSHIDTVMTPWYC